MVKRFSSLAAQPLDRNSYDMRPLLPTLSHELKYAAHLRWRRLAHRARGILRRRERERIYYRRVFDPNSPGWRAVRILAEPRRAKIPDVLRRDAVDACLPPPEREIITDGPIRSTSGAKILLGLALWGE